MKKGHTVKEIIGHLLGQPLPERMGGTVGDFMSSPPITIHDHADIRDRAEILDKKKFKCLPVVDETGRLQGVVSRADIVKAMAKR